MEKEKKLTVESVHEEEKVMDEFDMTEIAKNIGCFTPAPKQQKQQLNAQDVQGIADKVLTEMDNEDLSDLSDEEVKREFEERLAKERQEKQKELDKQNGKTAVKVKKKLTKDEDKFIASNDSEVEDFRVRKLQGKDLHFLKIERNCPRNTVLDILRTMCLEVEAFTKGKHPSDFSETPCFLSVKDWNKDIQELSDDEYWEVDLKEPYDLTDETKGKIDDDLYPLINLAVHCFSFYRKKSNFIEEDGIWLEKGEDGEWQPMLTFAMNVNKQIRSVMPENVDKLFGFNLMDMFSKKSMEAMAKREAMFNDEERHMVNNLIKHFGNQLFDVTKEDLIKEVKNKLLDVPKALYTTVQIDIDETEVHLMMFIAMMLNKLSTVYTGMDIKTLAKTKSGNEKVDDMFKTFFEAFNVGKQLKKVMKDGKNKV